MVIFGWIVVAIVGLLVAFSAICWGVFVLANISAWKHLGIRVFRIAMVVVLLYINVYIYAHVFGYSSPATSAVIELGYDE